MDHIKNTIITPNVEQVKLLYIVHANIKKNITSFKKFLSVSYRIKNLPVPWPEMQNFVVFQKK